MNKSAILLGSKPGSVVALLLLLQRGWDVKAVVSSSHQANWLPEPSLYKVAKSLGIQTVETEDDLSSYSVDLVISYMFRRRVQKKTLLMGRYPINFHPGPLPGFGGWAFYNVAILENSPDYGCTCHIMDSDFDTGPLVKVRKFSINPRHETAYSLERKTQIEMTLLFQEILTMYEVDEELASENQHPEKMRYLSAQEFRRLKEVSVDASTEEIDRISRAFWYPPYDLAFMKTPSGAIIEIVPDLAKKELAPNLHESDLTNLMTLLNLKL